MTGLAQVDNTTVIDDLLRPERTRDVLHCSFFEDSSTQTPIQKILSKAIPSRCKIRSLVEITSNFCRQHDYIYTFIKGIVTCSLRGMYPHAAATCSQQNKTIIAQTMNMMSMDDFLGWLQGKQQLLFFILKEYLVYAVDSFPALKRALMDHYDWGHFAGGVIRCMDKVRSKPLQHENIDGLLQTTMKKSNHVVFVKRSRKTSFMKILFTEAERIDDINNVVDEKQVTPMGLERLIYEIIIRRDTEKEPFFDLLRSFPCRPETVEALRSLHTIFCKDNSKAALKKLLSTLPRGEFELIKDFAMAHDRKAYTRTYALPLHITKAQIVALRKKHDRETGEPLPPTAGVSLYCNQCRTFKGFVAQQNRKTKRQTNACAFGHAKVLVSLDTLSMFCGKKVETTTASTNAGDERKRLKDRRKKLRNARCANNELSTTTLVGQVVQFYNRLITICPFCGQTCLFDCRNFIRDKFFCGCCMERNANDQLVFHEKMCCYCGSRRNIEIVPTVPTEANPHDSNYLCKKCNKMWIRASKKPLTVETIKTGLARGWTKLEV